MTRTRHSTLVRWAVKRKSLVEFESSIIWKYIYGSFSLHRSEGRLFSLCAVLLLMNKLSISISFKKLRRPPFFSLIQNIFFGYVGLDTHTKEKSTDEVLA